MSDEKIYRVKNWKEHQHYRDRRPLWIKIYTRLLDDYEWHRLDGDTAKTLLNLWILASEGREGILPPVREIAFRLRKSEKEITREISELYHFLEQVASKPLADGYQNASLERERETETEKEAETERETETDIVPPNVGTLARSAKARSKPNDSTPPVVSIPLADKTEHHVTEADVATWQECFPGVDVVATLRSIRAWNLANPTKRKTKRGIANHIRSWLDREQNRAGGRSCGKPPAQRQDMYEHNRRELKKIQERRKNGLTTMFGNVYDHGEEVEVKREKH